jgi:AraC-like DNA-binding protein
MDRHDISGATAKDVARVHQEDLKIQERFGCRGLTYWFDEQRGTAFCLIDAPNEDAVKEMHNHAHGLVPNQIIEVQTNDVESFLGRIQDPVMSNDSDEQGLLLINNPAFRIIMAIELQESVLIRHRVKKSLAGRIHKAYQQLVKVTLIEYKGRRVEHVKDGFLVSFSSISNAIGAAVEIQSGLKKTGSALGRQLHVQIGISAGVPVTENDAFFGDTIEQARQLCEIAQGGQTLISSAVNAYLRNDDVDLLNKKDTIKILNPLENEFLEQLSKVALDLWNDPEFTIELFNTKMGLSKSQLYRKTISLTALSPSDFMKEYRLRMSLKHLAESKGNVSEIAYDSGFSSPSYFSKCFQKRYGISPSEFLHTYRG